MVVRVIHANIMKELCKDSNLEICIYPILVADIFMWLEVNRVKYTLILIIYENAGMHQIMLREIRNNIFSCIYSKIS